MSQQYVEVTLAGTTRLMRFDYNAVCDIEEKFDKGIAAILSTEQIGLRALRVFYWAGLKWKDQGLTVERVGMLLHKEMTEGGKDMQSLFEPVMKAMKQSKLIGSKSEEDEAEEDEEGKNA